MSIKNPVLNQRIIELANNYINQNKDMSIPVTHYLHPDELAKKIDLSLPENGCALEELYESIEQYLSLSVRTGHKQFFNQLWSGFSFIGFLGELITCLSNTSMYTYEVAPVATLMETELIKRIGELCGYENPDGLFLSGGSSGNLQAMLIARNRVLPDLKSDGFCGSIPLTAFVSSECHYSFEKNANILGIGMSNVRKVRTNEEGQMIPDELESAIQKSHENGERPFFTGATAGTTVKGSYDPLNELAQIAQEHNLWFHVDGSFGGGDQFSPKQRILLQGLNKADSFVCNAHKLMGLSIVCSFFLVKEKGHLFQTNSVDGTNYIYHDDGYGDFDLGKKSLQCGRKVDALKFWLAWKYYGSVGYAERVDRLFELATYAEEIVNRHSSLELMSPRSFVNICFRYRPSKQKDLNRFNLNLREELARSGKTLVNYASLGENLVIRLVITNPELNRGDIDLFFDNLIQKAISLDCE